MLWWKWCLSKRDEESEKFRLLLTRQFLKSTDHLMLLAHLVDHPVSNDTVPVARMWETRNEYRIFMINCLKPKLV
jgi:hypothetical protein